MTSPDRPDRPMLLAPDWHFAFISFHSSYLLPTIPASFLPLSAYSNIPPVPSRHRLMLDRPGLPRDQPGHTTGRLGPSQTHSGRTTDHSPLLAATRMMHYHRRNPSRRPITITPLFATPGTCYHGHHSSILSSVQVLCGLLIPSLSITPWRIVHRAIPLPFESGLFPIIPTTIIIIITIQPSSLADWGQSAFKSCAGVELCSALGWDLNLPRLSSYVSCARPVRTSSYYWFPESREPSSHGRLAGLTLFRF